MTTDFATAPSAYGLNGPSAAVTVEKSTHASHTEILTPPTTFDHDPDFLEDRFDQVITGILAIYPEGLSDTEFRRSHLFYSLFTAVAHRNFGIPGLPSAPQQGYASPEAARNSLERVDGIFEETDHNNLSKDEIGFLQDSRRATTDEKVRVQRTQFLLKLMS
ncbi:hypothetical protein [Methylococcus sp. EFPC2]|uniref:hypothetical protein n=1 Tax=Methylococcus sp. EFPC2 TaxID=2812648 RepID=UPI0019681001|nr:hypothetical protein [Methylococcus sp. EFPC2]QSA98512.1 hypothetical protein JWZ97_06845 [Methylococcus sp. EFPC2]